MTIDDTIDLTADQQVELAQARRRRLRWATRALSLVVATLLMGGGGLVYLRRPATVVTIDDAIASYRNASARTASQSATSTAADEASAAGDPAGPATAAEPQSLRPAGGGVTPVGSNGGDSRREGPPPAAGPRSRRAETTTAKQKRPEPGVYSFTTKGYEYTDALGGSRHEYPSETAVTISATSCGWTMRWQPLQERWDESALCFEPGGVAIRKFTTHHEFFQRSLEQAYPCPAGSLVYSTDETAGHQWSLGCKGDAGGVNMTARVVGPEEVQVGSARVRALHIHYDATLYGANRGTQAQDRWLDPASGMNLRIDSEIKTESDSPFGVVHYEEHYSITAASLTPRR